LGAGPAVLQNIARFEQGSAAVVTGQQVALFGGPAYSFYKVLSALETVRLLAKSGVDTVPIFWMATEDHDLDEVRHTTFFHDGNLNKFELPAPTGAPSPVGPQKLGPQIEEMVRAGFAAQVKVTGRSTALFYLGNGGREAIRSNGSQFHADSTNWSAQELASAISASPESFSPSALLRPVVQDYLLPTIAYIGGPSEISYFAQSEVFYSKLLHRQP